LRYPGRLSELPTFGDGSSREFPKSGGGPPQSKGAVFLECGSPLPLFPLVTTPSSLLQKTPLNWGRCSSVSSLDLPQKRWRATALKRGSVFGVRQPSAAFSPGHDTQFIAAKDSVESGPVFFGVQLGFAPKAVEGHRTPKGQCFWSAAALCRLFLDHTTQFIAAKHRAQSGLVFGVYSPGE